MKPPPLTAFENGIGFEKPIVINGILSEELPNGIYHVTLPPNKKVRQYSIGNSWYSLDGSQIKYEDDKPQLFRTIIRFTVEEEKPFIIPGSQVKVSPMSYGNHSLAELDKQDEVAEGSKPAEEEWKLTGVDNRARFNEASKFRMQQWTQKEMFEAIEYLTSLSYGKKNPHPAPVSAEEEEELWDEVGGMLAEKMDLTFVNGTEAGWSMTRRLIRDKLKEKFTIKRNA